MLITVHRRWKESNTKVAMSCDLQRFWKLCPFQSNALADAFMFENGEKIS